MRLAPKWILLTFVLGSTMVFNVDASAERPAAPGKELNTTLMHATFRVTGPKRGEPQKLSFGTVFVMGVPFKSNPKVGHLVLVTAAHVFDDIDGDNASLLLRKRDTDGTYATFPFTINIRKGGKPLYVRHPTADVAAMYIELPNEVPLTGLTPDSLADDTRLEAIEVHPGDEAFVLGFPLATTGPGAFPILRAGKIASYPLTPATIVKEIYFDLFLHPGNSGGPVYFTFINRVYKGGVHLGVEAGILGLVTQEARSVIPEFKDRPLNFGVVVPATYIREAIDLLPPKAD